jgi:hypothetical protein
MGRADGAPSGALGAFTGSGGDALGPWSTTPLIQGPLQGLSGHIVYRIQSARGVPTGPGERYSTTINEVSPGITWAIGNHWSLSYSPTWTFYTNDALRDSVDHTATLSWRTRYQNWRFNAHHRTSTADSVIIETGRQTKRRHYQTMVGASSDLNSWLSWDHRLRYNVRNSDTFGDFQEYSLEERLTRSLADRGSISLGALYGYVNVSEGVDHQHLSPRLNADWQVGPRLGLNGYVGVEHRWFKGGLGDTTNPIFDVSARYALTDSTGLYVGYNRSVSPSFFQDTVTRREILDATLTQRFLGRYFFSATAARRTSSYRSANPGDVDGRRDRYVHYSFRLSTALGERGHVSIFYQPEADNSSNRPLYTYGVRSYGAEASYRF